MRVSVAMATYNGAAYLRQQLDSILQNLTDEDELVISDDGSTDETRKIIEEYCSTNPGIRLIDGPGAGVIANFEHAIASCRGQYIFLADQDDVWKADKVDKVLKTFEERACVLVIHDAKVVSEDLKSTLMESFFSYRGSKAGFIANMIKNRYMGCCMAFKKELVEWILPIPKDIPMHDQWIGMISDGIFGKSVFLQDKLLLYRRHEHAVSDFGHNSVSVMIQNRLLIYRYYRDRIRKNRKERKL